MDSKRTELGRALIQWLEAERSRLADRARSLGFPMQVEIHEPVGSVEKAVAPASSGISFRTESSLVTPVCVPGYRYPLLEDDLRVQEPSPVARALCEAYGEGCKVWRPGPPAYEEGPAAFVQGALLNALRTQYLAELPSLDQGAPGTAAALAGDLLDLLARDEITFVMWLPLGGVALPADAEEVTVGGVRVRRLTGRELGELNRGLLRDIGALRWPPPFITGDIYDERCALEVRTACPKTDFPRGGYLAQRVLLGLRLLGFELNGRGEVLTWTEPGPKTYQGSVRFRMAKRGSTREVSEGDLKDALELADRISEREAEGLLLNPQGRKQIALHRFHLGASDDAPGDALMDYVIALEALFLSNDLELKLRLRLFGALFCGDTPEQRRDVFADLGLVYDCRSKLVHGSLSPSEANIREAATAARAICAEALVRSLRSGWPRPEELTERLWAEKVPSDD